MKLPKHKTQHEVFMGNRENMSTDNIIKKQSLASILHLLYLDGHFRLLYSKPSDTMTRETSCTQSGTENLLFSTTDMLSLS